MTYSAREFYKQSDVVAEYEKRRFAGALGRRRWAAEQQALGRVFDRLPASSTVLDCPVGNGRWAEQLLRRGHRVTGVDVSQAMLDAASERMQRIAAGGGEPARLLLGDAENLQFPSSSFDVVFSHALTKHLPADVQDRAFAEFARVSRQAVVCSFSVLSGLNGALWRARRLQEAYGRRPQEIAELAAAHGFRIDVAVPCTTGLGVEQTMLFVRA
jgi:ubiquinone/menaquinone biosynthesis C-methylase UbiE